MGQLGIRVARQAHNVGATANRCPAPLSAPFGMLTIGQRDSSRRERRGTREDMTVVSFTELRDAKPGLWTVAANDIRNAARQCERVRDDIHRNGHPVTEIGRLVRKLRSYPALTVQIGVAVVDRSSGSLAVEEDGSAGEVRPSGRTRAVLRFHSAINSPYFCVRWVGPVGHEVDPVIFGQRIPSHLGVQEVRGLRCQQIMPNGFFTF
jgi:hypothetical protein